MSPPKFSFTITYKKPGTVPPIFLAGSFSDPQWQPKEMDCSTDDDGEHTFRSEILVEPGKDYQFKLRIGQDNWWALSEEYPVATDDSGNTNNALCVPAINGDKNDGPSNGDDTVINPKDEQPILPAKIDTSQNPKDTDYDLKTPLFAHERLGAYKFAEDESEEEACPSNPDQQDVKLRTDDTATDNIDVNDPTLETFPSDRASILDALRTIQTHLNEDHTHLEDIQASPRPVSSSRSNIDTVEEKSHSQASLSPNSMRKREQPSYSGFGRSRSACSLGSIAEEPKLDEPSPEQPSTGEMSPDTKEPETPPVITFPNPNTVSAFGEPNSPLSEEDEAVVMKSPDLVSREKTRIVSPAYSETTRAVPGGRIQENEQATQTTLSEIDNKDPQLELNGTKDQPETPTLTEVYHEKLNSNKDRTSENSSLSSVSAIESRVDVIRGKKATSKWLQGLLSNKLPIILATGALAVAMGISWMNSKPDN